MNLHSIYLLIFWISGFYHPYLKNYDDNTTKEIYQHLSYLASDELKGRGIGSPELDSAANYIADYFKKVGLKPAPGTSTYFQEFELERKEPPIAIEFSVGEHQFTMNENIVMLSGGGIELEDEEIKYVNIAMDEEIPEGSLKGKIVLTKLGFTGQDLMESYFPSIEKKREMIRDSGALALVEIYNSKEIPWDRIVGYFGRGGSLSIHEEGTQFPHFLINDPTIGQNIEKLKVARGRLLVELKDPEILKVKNVLGYVEGTDPNLQDEVLLLSAHYDHVGIGRPVDDGSGIPDSIYNGARDNASGTVALMMTAKKFAKNPGKRPVAFIAFTAEESGLIGSRYYASNPIIPLDEIAFNFNNDNGGYNDTTIVTVVGAGRNNASGIIEKSIESCGLQMYQSADLDKTFFRGSDNISLSTKGIPSVTYSLGFRGMDEEIRKYYHQPADEVESMDMNYVSRWIEGYIKAATNIANMDTRPFWAAGDELEEAGKTLYGIK